MLSQDVDDAFVPLVFAQEFVQRLDYSLLSMQSPIVNLQVLLELLEHPLLIQRQSLQALFVALFLQLLARLDSLAGQHLIQALVLVVVVDGGLHWKGGHGLLERALIDVHRNHLLLLSLNILSPGLSVLRAFDINLDQVELA